MDRDDDCGIFSRGKYSIFLWNNDECKRILYNDPNCPIPLMTVNEGVTDALTALLAGGPEKESATIDVNNINNINNITRIRIILRLLM